MKKHKHHKVSKQTINLFNQKKKPPTILRNIFLVVMCVVLFFSSMYGVRCFTTKVCDAVIIDKFVRNKVTMLMPQGALQVEVVDTPVSRELGLSKRLMMKNDEGMLFVFDVPGRYGFWMKDMSFPLDIMWINQNGIVVNIERNVTPESYKEKKTYINQADASYVLEINAGQAEKFGLYLGSKIKIAD